MATLTEEMKTFIENNLAWVTTIGKDGQLDLGPKMSMFVLDDHHLAYHERTAGQVYRNLQDGSPLVIALGGGTLTSEPACGMVLEHTRCVWLRARMESIRRRIGESDGSRPLFKDADRLFREREAVYSRAVFAVDTDGLTPREAACRIAGIPGLLED